MNPTKRAATIKALERWASAANLEDDETRIDRFSYGRWNSGAFSSKPHGLLHEFASPGAGQIFLPSSSSTIHSNTDVECTH